MLRRQRERDRANNGAVSLYVIMLRTQVLLLETTQVAAVFAREQDCFRRGNDIEDSCCPVSRRDNRPSIRAHGVGAGRTSVRHQTLRPTVFVGDRYLAV